MKKRKLSLTLQLVLTMVGIVALTVLLCCIFNNTFLERYYIYNKQKELQDGYRQVERAYQNSGGELGSPDFDITFETICANGNITMLIVDESGLLVRSSYNNVQRLQMQLENMVNILYGARQNRFQVLVENDDYTIQRQTDERLSAEYLVLLGMLEDGGYVYMRTPLESIRESAAITNQFFVLVSAASIIISIFVIIVLSRSISRPIRSLSDIAGRMTELDFEAKYHSGQHVSYELEELGQSMNGLSQKLEETISELKSANVQLQQDIERKVQVDEMRKEFLSNVSHELKTPLALIQGYAEGLKECVNDDGQSRAFYCDVIMDESDKMNQMVKKLLTLNQLEFGNEKVEMVRFDVVELIGGILQSASLMAAQKGVTIRFAQEAPVYVWGEEFKVEEVITNYLTNAMNHAKGEKLVDIRILQREGMARICVFNTGEPIPEEELDKIWIKFYKVDKARTREYGGSGIGLSIVRAIMDSFHQECGVKNYENGVEFWMELESNN